VTSVTGFFRVNSNSVSTRGWLKLVFAVALAVALAFAALLLLDWNAPSHEPAWGSLTAVSGDAKDLLARGFLDKSRLAAGETLRLHLMFENHSAAALHLSVRDIQTPGFRAVKLPAAFELAAGASEAFDFDLPAADGGRYRLAVLYQFARATGSVEESVVSLGPVEVRTALGALIEHSTAPARQIYSVVKDFTLPVVLAILAYLFNRRQSRRDQRAREAESARDQQVARDRETRETRQQIWSSQIPRFRTYAEKHYLPIVSNIRHLQKDFDSFTTASAADQNGEVGVTLLFRLLLFLRRMVYLREEEGSVFFKVRRAEVVFQQAWWSLNFLVEKSLRIDRRDQALALLAPDEPYHHFLEVAEDEPVFEELRIAMLLWIGSGDEFVQSMALAQVMLAVLGFEANRPFDEYWYGSPDEFEGKPVGEYKFPAEPKERIEKLRMEYATYKKEVEEYCAKWRPA
jgi:hypothetical protein